MNLGGKTLSSLEKELTLMKQVSYLVEELLRIMQTTLRWNGKRYSFLFMQKSSQDSRNNTYSSPKENGKCSFFSKAYYLNYNLFHGLLLRWLIFIALNLPLCVFSARKSVSVVKFRMSSLCLFNLLSRTASSFWPYHW